jgi:hypothetical protein
VSTPVLLVLLLLVVVVLVLAVGARYAEIVRAKAYRRAVIEYYVREERLANARPAEIEQAQRAGGVYRRCGAGRRWPSRRTWSSARSTRHGGSPPCTPGGRTALGGGRAQHESWRATCGTVSRAAPFHVRW